MNEDEQKAFKDKLMKLALASAMDGKLVEAGWEGFVDMCMPGNASPLQIKTMRMTFYAGVQFLFTTLHSIMEPGHEPTQQDIDVITSVRDELAGFAAQVCAEVEKNEGNEGNEGDS